MLLALAQSSTMCTWEANTLNKKTLMSINEAPMIHMTCVMNVCVDAL